VSDASRRTIHLSEPVLGGNEWAYVKECLDTGWISSGGSFVERFEQEIARLVGSPRAVACINGTAALHVALLLAGVGPGDLVLVPSLTFIAPVNAVRYLGADPVFLGCDRFMNIDPALVETFCQDECDSSADVLVERQSGRRIKAIVVVHVFGNPCDLAPILETGRRFDLPVVEDATESLGSRWTAGALKGRFTGTAGDYGVYSFNGNKIITTGGGGMLVAADPDDAIRARHLTTQAKIDPVRYVHDEVGFNYRLSNVAAAIGVAQLERLPEIIASRKRAYALYCDLLNDVPGLAMLGPPPGTSANHWLHTLLVEPEAFGMDREALMSVLAEAGIETRPVWYPNHLQAPYAGCRAFGTDRAMWLWERALSLPAGAGLSDEDVKHVSGTIQRSRG
jgi:perosamine synthetase